jgi:uncharacterized protein (TIGR02117 family)
MSARASIFMAGVVLLSALAASGCASVRSPVFDAPPESLRSIYVVRRGWHTGVALPTADWPNQDWSVLAQFAEADYLEFGWGDRRFYQSEPNTFWETVRAVLWPTPSVVHVIGLENPVVDNAHALDIVEVRVPIDRLTVLATAIEQEFTSRAPTQTGTLLVSTPDPNAFFKARRRFFFPRMCNWWTASRLREAGCLVTPGTTIRAARVMHDARVCARQ